METAYENVYVFLLLPTNFSFVPVIEIHVLGARVDSALAQRAFPIHVHLLHPFCISLGHSVSFRIFAAPFPPFGLG